MKEENAARCRHVHDIKLLHLGRVMQCRQERQICYCLCGWTVGELCFFITNKKVKLLVILSMSALRIRFLSVIHIVLLSILE